MTRRHRNITGNDQRSAPIRTREHQLEDFSVNAVERKLLEANCTIQVNFHDYGVDLLVQSYADDGQRLPDWFSIQVKAHEQVDDTRGEIKESVKLFHLRNWYAETMPFFLIVYDMARDTAWWQFIQRYVQEKELDLEAITSQTHSVGIPTENRLTSEAARKFVEWKERIRERVREGDKGDYCVY